MVKASKDEEAHYPAKPKREPSYEGEGKVGDRESEREEETLEQYYMRQQGGPNRNEVIPTWRRPPPDSGDAEQKANAPGWKGEGPKDVHFKGVKSSSIYKPEED